MSQRTQQPQFHQLTTTRYLAAVMVLILHFGLYERAVFPFDRPFLRPFFNNAGQAAVQYFFVLSGFVLMATYRDRTLRWGSFMQRRLARIYPLYLLALVLLVVVNTVPAEAIKNWFIHVNLLTTRTLIKLVWQHLRQLPFVNLLLTATMTQAWNVVTTQAYNGPAWSLSVELFFYAAFPWLINAFRHRSARVLAWGTACLLVLLMAITYTLQQPNIWVLSHGFFHSGSPLLNLPAFLAGMVVYEAGLRFTHMQPLVYRLVYLLSGSTIIVLLLCIDNFPLMLLSPLFALFIWGLAYDQSGLTRFLSRPFLRHLGEISYGVYILQIPVFVLFIHWLNGFTLFNDTGDFYTFAVFMGVTAAACYRWVERPVQRWLNYLSLSQIEHKEMRQRNETVIKLTMIINVLHLYIKN